MWRQRRTAESILNVRTHKSHVRSEPVAAWRAPRLPSFHADIQPLQPQAWHQCYVGGGAMPMSARPFVPSSARAVNAHPPSVHRRKEGEMEMA